MRALLGGEPLAWRASPKKISSFKKKCYLCKKITVLKYKTMKTKNEVEQPKRLSRAAEWRAAQEKPIIEIVDLRAVMK